LPLPNPLLPLAAFEPVRLVVTDMDGVLTDGSVLAFETGEFVRNVNSKDAFAIRYAVLQGVPVVVISGGTAPGMRLRLEQLGVTEVHMAASHKLMVYQDLIARMGLTDEQVCYIGDDMPDLPVMLRCGLPIAPADAAADVRAIARYTTLAPGGQGVLREVLETLLKAQSLWYAPDAYHW
jgi:3-deoxy-D-manno-octulosonate 8-phosphate phosphatase (KDO 8-P phosphatase)